MKRMGLAASALSVLAMAQGVQAAEIAAADDPANAVEAVVVTGEKTARGLQQTVSSVAVTTAARIERENIQDRCV